MLDAVRLSLAGCLRGGPRSPLGGGRVFAASDIADSSLRTLARRCKVDCRIAAER